MIKIKIQSSDKGYFLINDLQFQKGSLTVKYTDDGVVVANTYVKLDEISVDGAVASSVDDLRDAIGDVLFNIGGGAGGNGGVVINAGFGLSKSGNDISLGGTYSIAGVTTHVVSIPEDEALVLGNATGVGVELINTDTDKGVRVSDGTSEFEFINGDGELSNISTGRGITFDKDTGLLTYKGDYTTDLKESSLVPKSFVSSEVGGKVDKVSGKGLSANDFTDAHKNAVETMHESVFRGRFPSFEELEDAIPVGESGWYAYVEGVDDEDVPIVHTYRWVELAQLWEIEQGKGSGHTAQEIKQMYESNLNTNAFTDAYQTALQQAVSHEVNKNNPHNVTKAQVGLGNVDNTADINKPLSIPQKEYIDSLHSGTPEGDKGTFSVNGTGQYYAIDLDGVADLVYTQIDALNGKWEYKSKKQMLHRCMWVSLRTAAHEQVHIQENMNVGAIKVVDALYYGGGLEETYLRYVNEDGDIIKIYVIVEDSGKRCFWRKERW